MLTPGLRSKLNQLWDRFWSAGITDPLTIIEQVSYLLFMKWLDERDLSKARISKHSAASNYTPIFSGKFAPGNKSSRSLIMANASEARWSSFSQLPAKQMFDIVAGNAFPFIQALNPDKYPFAAALKDAVFMIPKPSVLSEAVSIIDSIYSDIESAQYNQPIAQDTIADVYLHLLDEIPATTNTGRFNTPRHLVRFIVELIEPDINDMICDPCCASGIFLTEAYRFILSRNTSANRLLPEDENGFRNGNGDEIGSESRWKKLLEDTFYGFDADITMVRLAMMNLILHNIPHPRIAHLNSLSKRYDELEPALYSIIVTHPPSTGTISQKDAGRTQIDSNRVELLYIDRVINMLQPGGRAGIIVPDNVLSGTTDAHKALKKRLLQTCKLTAVISLPSSVFIPQNDTKTSILIFSKSPVENIEEQYDHQNLYTQHVWFYKIENDGYSQHSAGQGVGNKPLPAVVNEYRQHAEADIKIPVSNSKHFHVPVADIISGNYNLTFEAYQPYQHEEFTHEPAKYILTRMQDIEKEIAEQMDILNSLIK